MKKEPDDAARAQAVARLAKFREVDVLVLFECATSSDKLLHALKAEVPRFEAPLNPPEPDRSGRSKFFCRFAGSDMEPWVADDRLDVRRLGRSGFTDVLLAAFHFIDAWNNSPEKQHDRLEGHKTTLLDAESKAGHS